MKTFGVVGWSGSGKTTLLIELLPELTGRGLRISTIKHTHHGFTIDRPGKDSHRHREAGAKEVVIASASRWAMIHELRGDPEPDMTALIARMTPVDLVLVEGFKSHPHDKLEVYRPSLGKPLLCREDPTVVAVASDEAVPDLPVPAFDLADVSGIAAFILKRCGIKTARREGAA